MSSILSKNLSLVKNIKLFSGLENKELETVLSNAIIIKYQSGKNLFLAEEKISDFKILISGSVKIFALSEEGEESILQIIKPYQSISNIFATHYLASGQAMENSEVISIPLTQLKEHSKSSLQLLANLLQEEAQRNIDLLKQMTNLKLANAEHKLGQFLLGMAFEKGDKAKNIELKTSKAAIASYLGIKPETLSRALNKLKSWGDIAVEKNKITLLKPDSLCSFCDKENAQKCSHKNSSFCIHN